MANMYWHYSPRKHIGANPKVEIDDDELSPTAKQILGGIEHHIGDVVGDVWGFFEQAPGDFDALNALNARTADWILRPDEPGDHDLKPLDALRRILGLSWLSCARSLGALCNDDFRDFSINHTTSVRMYGAFQTYLQLSHECAAEPPEPSGPRYALSHRLDQVLKRPFTDFCSDLLNRGLANEVRTINDLLEIPGYDPRATKIAPVTLKAWARTAGVRFKAGAPRKKKL